MKRWKIFGAGLLFVAGLYGCELTPRAVSAPLAAATPQVQASSAPASSEGGQEAPPQLPPLESKDYPKTEAQLLAEKSPPKTTPGKRKKARNADVGDFKRDYSELIKKPASVGFHPREEQFERALDIIHNSFVETVKDDKVLAGIKREFKIYCDQAKIDSGLINKLDGNLENIYKQAQQVFDGKIHKDVIGYLVITGALDSLKDAYSVLMTPSEYSKLRESLQSTTFGGIGIYIELDRDNGNQLTVFEPIEGTPAYKAGLEPGDKIMKIDTKPTKGISIEVAQSLIRGEAGSTVNLTIARRGKTLEVPVERAKIKVVSVTSKMYPGQIGYIRLRAFGSDTGSELKATLAKFKSEGAKGVILDLRNNGGGYIDSAVEVVGEFAPANSLVVYTIDRDKHKRLYPSHNAGGIGVPLVVMINEFSASASEITAGALRDHKIATLVGDHSFGKGSVQQLFPLEQSFPPVSKDSPQLKLTIARFYTPNGTVIDKQGIEPQVVVDMEPRFVGKPAHDTQLKKALELLGGSLPGKP